MISPLSVPFTAPLLAAFAASAGGVWLSIRLARRLGALDRPGHRSSHERATPRLGGIGIALGLFGVLIVWGLAPLPRDWPRPDLGLGYLRATLAGGLVAFGFGLADDLRGLPVWAKFGFQLLCAALGVVLGTTLHALALPFGPLMEFGAVAGALAAGVWIVFFMNAYNFMDGMDGQAATFGILASVGLVYPFVSGLDPWPGWISHAMLLFILIGALAGFLRFNVSRPARAFMGDGGAQMCGFALALAALEAGPVFVPAALLALWPFVYDVVFTLARRAFRGENVFRGHRDHLYQRLLRTGLTHNAALMRGVAFHLACLGASILYSSRALREDGAAVQLGCLAAVAAATLAYTVHLWWRENTEKSES